MNKKQDAELFFNQKYTENNEFIDYFDDIQTIDDLTCYSTLKETAPISRDWIYMYQDRTIFNYLLSSHHLFNESSRLLDVGSKLSSVLFFASLINTTYLEPRLRKVSEDNNIFFPKLNLGFIKGEAQDIPLDDCSVDIVTSLHAMEHFGLGRYGDTIDYYGDQKALKEFNRVLKKNGRLFISVPANENQTIQFNGQRIYNPDTINAMLISAGFDISASCFILSLGMIRDKDGNLIEPITTDREIFKKCKITDQAVYVVFAKKL